MVTPSPFMGLGFIYKDTEVNNKNIEVNNKVINCYEECKAVYV
jgi:hypothetical protein